MKPPCCPTCKKPPVRYREVWSPKVRCFDADPDGWPSESAGVIDEAPEHLIAVCAKGHEWSPRASLRELRQEGERLRAKASADRDC